MKSINKKKKNKKIVVASVIAFIVIMIGFIFAYVLIKDLKQEDILRNEFNSLSNKDFTKDRYNTRIKTKDDYAVVEKAIKEYFDEYATNLQNLPKIAHDKKITNLLSADNYEVDGPDFVKSKQYLNETKTSFNTKLTELKNMTTEEERIKKIENKNLDKYYVDLYKELMLSEKAENGFSKSLENLKILEDNTNKILNMEEAVINLLISEKGKWTIEKAEENGKTVGKIVFQSTDTLNKYNELIKDYQNNRQSDS